MRDGRFQSYLALGGPAWLHERLMREANGVYQLILPLGYLVPSVFMLCFTYFRLWACFLYPRTLCSTFQTLKNNRKRLQPIENLHFSL